MTAVSHLHTDSHSDQRKGATEAAHQHPVGVLQVRRGARKQFSVGICEKRKGEGQVGGFYSKWYATHQVDDALHVFVGRHALAQLAQINSKEHEDD
jgi:hypothetical protein